MVIPLLLCLSISQALEFPSENKPERFNACYALTQLKISKDQEQLDAFFAGFSNSTKASNRITSDMLLKCYTTISLDTAEAILQQGQDLVLVNDFEHLVDIDMSGYTEANLGSNKEHRLLFQEIQILKDQAEREKEMAMKRIKETPPMFHAGPVYIMGVLIAFGAFLYWATGKVLRKPEKQGKGKKKN